MIKAFLVFCAMQFLGVQVFSAPADSSVTITQSKNSYQFLFNNKNGQIEVKQILNSIYTSNAYMVDLSIAETYNNQVVINEVECKVDNHTPRNFKPQYTYYSISDVFYSDERICYFPVVLPKKGSSANVTFTETAVDPRYFTSVYFSDRFDVAKKVLSFRIPRWMKVELKEMNFAGYNITKTTVYDSGSNEDVITYTAVDLARSRQEENSPGPTYLYPHILILSKSAKVNGKDFNFFGSVADMYAWCHGLAIDVHTDKAIIAAKAKELTAGVTGDMAKIKAIFNYVKENVRYLAFEDGIAGFKPEKADEVLRKKYGDCKGMANLTKELLTSLGYNARLCWLGTDHIAYDYQTPSLAVDNHMICGLIYNGKTMYLDATETYLGMNEYAERIQGRQVLMEDGDHYLLNKIPTADMSQNYDYEAGKLAIEGTSLKGSIKHLWKGEDKEEVLAGLNSTRKEKTDEAMMNFLSNSNSDYVINSLTLSPTTDPDNDVTASYALDHKNGVSSFSKTYYVDLDFKKEFTNSAINTGERKYDYWFNHKTNLRRETELTIPLNYKPSNIPPALDVINPDYEFHLSYENKPGKIIYRKSILIKNSHMPVSKFLQWNRDVERLNKFYNENITLKPIPE